MKCIKRLLSVLLCAALLTVCVLAGEIDPTRRDCSLTVRCRHRAEDVAYSLWRVAKVSEDVTFTLLSDFSASRVLVNNTDDWADIAETLAGWVESRELEPLDTAYTDQDGKARFTGLSTGLYLVIGEGYAYDGSLYRPDPFLVALPTRSDNTLPWEYDVTTHRKAAEKTGEALDLRVLKLWQGDEGHFRPTSVTVQLLRDGRVWETVELNASNGWEYRWTNLSDEYTWRVAEPDVPVNYTVLIRRDTAGFVITNTYAAEDAPQQPDAPDVPDTPDRPDKPGKPTTPDQPDKPGDGDLPARPSRPGRPSFSTSELPYTGTARWLAPILLGIGVLLFAAGLLRRRREG